MFPSPLLLSPLFFWVYAALLISLIAILLPRFKWNGKALSATRIFQALQVRVQDCIQPTNTVRGVYETFAEAVVAAPRTKPLGYDAANAGNWYYHKLTSIGLEDYPVIYWLKSAMTDSKTLVEIGGHVGIAYYGFSRYLHYPADFSWTILDVPSVMQAGETLARERGQQNLHFAHGGLDAIKGADILMTVGALQYLEANLASTIRNFQQQPKHVIINVTPVYDGPPFITLQNLGSVFCPYRIFNRQELVSSIEAMGYQLIDSWAKPRLLRIPGHPDKTLDHYSGFYFRANNHPKE